MKYFILSLVIFLCTDLFGFETYYHSVKAKNGDGVFSLLRRYHLNDHSCNRNEFLKLNNLTIKDELKVGREYKLPIHIFKYNGTSIRTTVGIDSWEQAVRIKDYNENILKDNLRKTRYNDSKILWVPHHELSCAAEIDMNSKSTSKSKGDNTGAVSDVKKKGTFLSVDMFGKTHKVVEVVDNSMKGKVYYIVSGHGGPDPGAMCNCDNTLCEDEYAYDVCLRLTRELMSHGATVHMIIQDKNDGIRDEQVLECDRDEFCMGATIPLNQKKRLHQRASAINNLYHKYKKQGVKDQVAIMVHIDSNNETKSQDVYFYHHKSSKGSKDLAKKLQNTFKEKYNYYQKGRGYKGFVKPRGLYMLNNTLPTAAFVELANIRNPNDHKRLLLNSNREALAKWLYEGIAAHHKVKIPR